MSEKKYSIKSRICAFLFGHKYARENCKMPNNLPAKDPNDFTLSESSTEFNVERFCPKCLSVTNHKEQMSNICFSCGSDFGTGIDLLISNRCTRKIYNGKAWVVQRKYEDGSFTISK